MADVDPAADSGSPGADSGMEAAMRALTNINNAVSVLSNDMSFGFAKLAPIPTQIEDLANRLVALEAAGSSSVSSSSSFPA